MKCSKENKIVIQNNYQLIPILYREELGTNSTKIYCLVHNAKMKLLE